MQICKNVNVWKKLSSSLAVHHRTAVLCFDLNTMLLPGKKTCVCIHGNHRRWCKTKCPGGRTGLRNSMSRSSVLTLHAFHNSSFRLSWPSCPRSRRRRLPNRWLASRKRRASWMLKCPSGMTTTMTSLCWRNRCAWSWWRWQTSPGEFGRTAWLTHTQRHYSSTANRGPFCNL